ncbi:hypothetical protein QAD02_023628 [Eretmocerus hayati]|uniref:Uncharacterized protein n=1 Tax=Eretmocerus hayati TaxID=131215 RepID=A0ACC2PW54_9HYME|nr:hypothetical protein QAD02_023628 [Eretmocerus hayati]
MKRQSREREYERRKRHRHRQRSRSTPSSSRRSSSRSESRGYGRQRRRRYSRSDRSRTRVRRSRNDRSRSYISRRERRKRYLSTSSSSVSSNDRRQQRRDTRSSSSSRSSSSRSQCRGRRRDCRTESPRRNDRRKLVEQSSKSRHKPRQRSSSEESRYTPPPYTGSPTLPHDDAEEMRAPTPQAVINAPSSTSASTSMQPTAVVTSQNDGNPRSTENIMSNVANDADVTIVAQTADKGNREIELDDDALRVLGVDPSKPLESKNPLRPELTVRWTVWKSDGLDDDTKKELLDKYVPDTTLAAQKLNPELLSILSEAAIKRDSHIESNQKLTGTALTALGSAVSSLLTCKNYSRVKLLETLHDTGKILSELHHEQLESRKACILPITNKNMKSVLQKAKPDEYLFGSNLSDKIKEAKVMEKVGNDLKSVPIKKPFNKNNFRNPQKKIAPDQNQSNYENQTNTQKKSSIPRRQTRSQTSRNRPDTRKR